MSKRYSNIEDENKFNAINFQLKATTPPFANRQDTSTLSYDRSVGELLKLDDDEKVSLLIKQLQSKKASLNELHNAAV